MSPFFRFSVDASVFTHIYSTFTFIVPIICAYFKQTVFHLRKTDIRNSFQIIEYIRRVYFPVDKVNLFFSTVESSTIK